MLRFVLAITFSIAFSNAFSISPEQLLRQGSLSPPTTRRQQQLKAGTTPSDDDKLQWRNLPMSAQDSSMSTDITQLRQLSQSDLITTVLQYQQQMQAYVLQAQQEKIRAVREAEDALLAQWAASTGSTTPLPAFTSSSTPQNSLAEYKMRNANLLATAASRSRWGIQEIQRVGSASVIGAPPPIAATGNQRVNVPPTILPSSVVSMPGSLTPSSATPPKKKKEKSINIGAQIVGDANQSAFSQRKDKVLSDGTMNTRWGAQEIARTASETFVGLVSGGPSSSSSSTPRSSREGTVIDTAPVPNDIVSAADHGLRADGGVGGPTLADRLNQNVGSPSTASSSSSSSNNNAYMDRKEKVAASGNKNTRWGAQEIARLQQGTIGVVTGGPSSSSSAFRAVLPSTRVSMMTASVPDDIITAADHGLRADGGVDGPTLADRLNTGATIVAASLPDSNRDHVQRNKKVQAEGSKNTRWGAQEIARLQRGEGTVGVVTGGPSSSSTVQTVLPSSRVSMPVPDNVVTAADHGVRADGGVDGPTLADRLNTNVGVSLVAASPRNSNSAHAQRNEKLKAEGSRNTRWGVQEIARLQKGGEAVGVVSGGPPSSSAFRAVLPFSRVSMASVPDDIITAADHGLRADGGVGGPTLADRLNTNFGATIVASSSSSPSGTNGAYAQRNQKVRAEGSKNTRWGTQEIARLQKGEGTVGAVTGGPPSSSIVQPVLPSSRVVMTPVPDDIISAADHGLRADGGVDGPTLADRLNTNVGAVIAPSLVSPPGGSYQPANGKSSPAKTAVTPSTSIESDEFKQRNDKIKKEGSKNTRWGTQEVTRIASGTTGSVSGSPSSASSAGPQGSTTPSPPDNVSEDTIVAADHGLRADGGVGGPSLADRLRGFVNAGARMIQDQKAADIFFATTVVSSEYKQRNKKVASDGDNNTRWGKQEIQRIQEGSSLGRATGGPPSSAQKVMLRSTVVTLNGGTATEPTNSVPKATITAADHGLRADGGVGGPTLTERLTGSSVNVGASIVSGGGDSSFLYAQRNSKVAAAAGQSRWAAQEIDRVKNGGAPGIGIRNKRSSASGSNIGATIVASS